MRTAVAIYCILTLVFLGVCAMPALGSGPGALLSSRGGQMLSLAVLANAGFAWMALAGAPGRVLAAAGAGYVAVQCLLALTGGVIAEIGALSFGLIGLIVLKGAMVVLAGTREVAGPPPQ